MEGLTVYISRVILLAVAVATLALWAHRGSPIRRDIALNVGLLTLAGWLGALTHFLPDHRVVLEHGILAAVIVHPYALALLSDHLVMIPRRVRITIGLGVLIGAVLALADPLVPVTYATLLAAGVFLLSEAYLMAAVVRAGAIAGGITRDRLCIAAVAPGALAFAGLMWGFGWYSGTGVGLAYGLAHLLMAIAAVATVLGFAPPLALRRHWRLVAMEEHLETSLRIPLGAGFRPIADHLLDAAIETTGASRAMMVLRPTEDEHFILVEEGASGLTALGSLKGAFERAFQGQETILLDDRQRDLHATDRRLLQRLGAKALLVVPFSSSRNAWGLLMTTYRWSPLFPGEDAEMLRLIGRQSATLLDQGRTLDDQAELIGDLRVQAEALERSNEELRAFSYAVSHDIRTPMVTHMWLIDELQQLVGPVRGHPEVKRSFERLQRNLDGMWELTSDLLELARMNTEPEEDAPVDLAGVIDEVIGTLRDLHVDKEVRFEFDRGEVPRVVGDRVRYQQLFANVLGNAVKYGPERGGMVRIRVARVGVAPAGRLEVRIEDQGPGVAPEHRERIFQVCVRAPDPLGRKIPGTGIGLAIARKVARQYDGDLIVEDGEDGGACFVFQLPMLRVHAPCRTHPPIGHVETRLASDTAAQTTAPPMADQAPPMPFTAAASRGDKSRRATKS